MNIETMKKLKIWLSQNKVCFVTNSISMPSNLLLPSLKTYIDYIPIHNFYLIQGIKNNEPFYGLNAFIEMLAYMLSNNNFDYVIYIDEDCFINDFEALIDEFKLFKSSNCCMAGIQDGGVLCHRNHSKIMVNTFLSFWNISLMRNKKITINTIIDYVKEKIKDDKVYKNFISTIKSTNNELYNFMCSRADKMILNIKDFRDFLNPENPEPPYCEIVRNDPNNPIEPHQTPYSFDDETEEKNFEPYYVLEQALIILTGNPIYYLFSTDLYNEKEIKNGETYDLSGLSSAVYNNIENIKEHKLIAVHTWYSRAYTKWPTMPIQLSQTKRINTIIKKFSKI